MADVSEPAKPDGPTRKSKRKAASKAKEDQSAAPVVENDNKDESKEAPKAESPNRSTSSPDPNCAICLSKLENKSFTDSCFHMFCFVCLLEWSKIKAECPLCKQPFKSIIHNVRSYDDYDQYHLERPESQFSYDTQNDRRFRYRTTMTHDHNMFGFRQRRYTQYTDPVASLLTATPTTVTTRQHWRRQRQAATSEFRRRVYVNGMRVVGLQDASGRSRNVSPKFFTSNPATTHRLVPWLNRELNALLYNHEEHVQFVLELILDLIKRFAIQSEDFYQHVYPFIGSHTRHFMHEFETFAKSPFCIISYDQKAVYEQQPEFVSDSDSVHSNDGNDSDVMIVSPSSAPAESRRRRRDPGAVRQHNPRTEITPVSLSLRDLLEEDDEPVTAHSGWESPIPGPSWHLNPDTGISLDLGSLFQPGPSSQSSNRYNRKRKKRSKVKVEGDDSGSAKHDSDSNLVDSETESGSDVVCVGYDKPWQERTPVIVSTDSEEDKMIEKAEKAKRRKEKMAKKEEESRRSRKRNSRSRSRSGSRSRHRMRSRSSSRYSHRRSGTRSRSRSRYRHKSSASRSRRSRSRSASRHKRYRTPSPYSRSKHRKGDHSRSIAFEDAFGYSRRTALSPESNRRKKKRDHNRSSRYSNSSRSRSRTPTRHRRDRYHSSRDSRSKQRSRSSSVEIMSSRHKHKKHKKHKRSRESEKDRDNEENVHYKIVNDKESGKKSKGDPLLSITIKRDKSEDIPVVSSTVDTAHTEIEMPENVVIRTEPITPPRPSGTATEPVTQGNDESQSTEPRQTSSSPHQKEDKERKREDSDSSIDCVEVRRKSFKKHPSGHKKSRRPLPRIPDPSASTVTSSTSLSNSGRRMPVLDAISQLFQGYNNPSITSTQVDQDSLIPGMMANFFDSRLSHLYGYPGPSLSDFLPRPRVPQVTSSDHPLVLSSSDDSDVVVESVKNGTGQAVSSTSSSGRGQDFQGLMYNILDRIPVISDDINSHKSVDVEEAIDVEELGNNSPDFIHNKSIPPGAVMEVFDSDDEVAASPKPTQQSNHMKASDTTDSSDRGIPEAGSSRTMSTPSCSGQGSCLNGSTQSRVKDSYMSGDTLCLGSSLVHRRSSGDEDQLVDVETCDSIEPSTSADVMKSSNSGTSTSSESKSKQSSVTDDESMDIDVTSLSTGQEVCSSFQEIAKSNSDNAPKLEHNSEESMDIDVVGGIETSDVNRDLTDHEESSAVSMDGSINGDVTSRTDLTKSVPNNHELDVSNGNASPKAVVSMNYKLASNSLVQADSSATVIGVVDTSSELNEGINASSSSCAHDSSSSLLNQETDSAVDSSSKMKSSTEMSDDENASENTSQSSECEEVVEPAAKPQIIEGASEISSGEESFVQMNQPQTIAGASDISSEEDSYEEDNQSASMSVPVNSGNQPQVIADDTSSDEGEISSDTDEQPKVVHGACEVSSENDYSSSSKGSPSKGNINALDTRYRSSPDSFRYSALPSSNYPSSTVEMAYRFAPDSRSAASHTERVPPAASKEESRSSGELSDESSCDEHVYDDISSSENFDSPGSPTDPQVDNKQQSSPTSSSAVHTREQEESLSEGEIVSD